MPLTATRPRLPPITLPPDAAPEAYAMFRDKRDGCLKVVLNP